MPAIMSRRQWEALLQVRICPNCKSEFKQGSPSQIYCTIECNIAQRPWNAHALAIFNEFRLFVAQHAIGRKRVIDEWTFHTLIRNLKKNKQDATEGFRRKVTQKLAHVMDRFRKGYYIDTPIGCKFMNPPLKPVCPIEHLYCLGTILPRSCPRRHPDCIYVKGNWQDILKLRGLHEFIVGEGIKRGDSRRGRFAIIGGSKSSRAAKSDGDAVRANANTRKNPWQQTPNRDRIQPRPNSM